MREIIVRHVFKAFIGAIAIFTILICLGIWVGLDQLYGLITGGLIFALVFVNTFGYVLRGIGED